MSWLKSLKPPVYLRNKYVVTGLAFTVWLGFLDRNNMLTQYQLRQEEKKRETSKEFFRTEIAQTRQEQKELSSPKKLEKFAREKYLMKKDNEDLFIITEKAPEKK